MLTEIDVHRVQPVDSLPGVVRPYGLVVPDMRDSDGPLRLIKPGRDKIGSPGGTSRKIFWSEQETFGKEQGIFSSE